MKRGRAHRRADCLFRGDGMRHLRHQHGDATASEYIGIEELGCRELLANGSTNLSNLVIVQARSLGSEHAIGAGVGLKPG